MLIFVVFKKSRRFFKSSKCDPFLQIDSKYAQKHIKKSEKSFTRKNSKSKKLGKWKKIVFFGPGGPNFDPFFTIFLQITSKYTQKHHI